MRALTKLREAGLVEMGPLGGWQLTSDGRDLLDMLSLLRELDDRPRRTNASTPYGGSAPRGRARTVGTARTKAAASGESEPRQRGSARRGE